MTSVHRESPLTGSATPMPAIARIQTVVLRWPVRVPVRTSFGTMFDRPALLVRVEDVEGAHGWGEVWCNFPACGAEHRARLVDTVLAPLLIGQAFTSPAAAFADLSAKTAVLALQSGEPGPIAQAIAGIDTALHDLAARRAGLPLWRLLGGRSDHVSVYASGINPDRPGEVVTALRGSGYTAFKLKVGFGEARDCDNLQQVRDAAGPGAAVMVDANQAWDLTQALLMMLALTPMAPAWVEEPLRADRPWHEWQQLAAASPLPLAAGENSYGDAAFDALIASRALGVVQPDLAKWGGISGVAPVIDRITAAGLRYCPHYLGAGIGLMASAHLLAARGQADGLLEVDSNENPLRSLLAPALASLRDGTITLGEAPGLGIEPDLAACRELCR